MYINVFYCIIVEIVPWRRLPRGVLIQVPHKTAFLRFMRAINLEGAKHGRNNAGLRAARLDPPEKIPTADP